jgi:hypothetical protein
MSIPLRNFGKTGVQISALGLAATISAAPRTSKLPSKSCTVPSMGASPFTFNSWEYYRGKTESWLGLGLQGRRDKVFLMTKVCTHSRDASLAKGRFPCQCAVALS